MRSIRRVLSRFRHVLPLSLTSFFGGSSRRKKRSPGARPRSVLSLEALEDRTLMDIALTNGFPLWVEQGPGPITQAQLTAAPDNRAAGAVEAVAIGPDHKVAYAATVNGGIWRTDDITATNPNWVSQTDKLPSLAISSIAFSPLHPGGQTLYAGTGQFTNGAERDYNPEYYAIGLYRTTNGGINWDLVGNSDLSGRAVRRVLPTALDANPNDGVADFTTQVVLVATGQPRDANGLAIGQTAGVFRSTNGGDNFTQVLAGDATDIIADPNNTHRFYAAIAGTGIYRSDDDGATWNLISTNIATVFSSSRNIELAAGKNGTSTVLYAGIIAPDVSGRGDLLIGLYRDVKGADGVDDNHNGTTDDPAEYKFEVIGKTGGIASTTDTKNSPILVTTAAPHNLGDVGTSFTVAITGVTGQPAADGQFRATVKSATTFTLDG